MYCLIFSTDVYPFGGGECAMYEFAQRLVSELELRVVWYGSRRGNLAFGVGETVNLGTDTSIVLKGTGPSPDYTQLITACEMDGPVQLVLTYGNHTHQVAKACRRAKIPYVCFWHFWTNAILLSPTTLNREIMANIRSHKPSPHFKGILHSDCIPVVNSYFTQQVIARVTGTTIDNILSPYIPLPLQQISPYIPNERHTILCLNLHPLKGGSLFKQLAINPGISCVGVLSEPFPDSDSYQGIPNLKVVNWVDQVDSLYSQARVVVVASLVDETYCRVVAECMNRGLPVVTTKSGNIPNLLGDIGVYIPSDPTQVKIAIRQIIRLYNSPTKLETYSQALLKQFKTMIDKEQHYITNIMSLIRTKLRKGVPLNIGMLCPWYEQGLGYQCRAYYKHLEGLNFGKSVIYTHILSFAPYFSGIKQHICPQEWEHPSIYYSRNSREKLTDEEIREFVTSRKIDIMLVPEIVWGRVLSLPALLAPFGCKVVGIPNIEISIESEIPQYKQFYRILSNNRLTYSTLAEYGIPSRLLGFVPRPDPPQSRIAYPRFTFGFFGGTCPTRRKQLGLLLASLPNLADGLDYQLIVTMQNQGMEARKLIADYSNDPRIVFMLEHMSQSQVAQISANCDMIIIITQHEGLGMGFYDAIQQGTPVLTYDAPPHNEIITPEIGVLIPPTYIPPTDNQASPIQSVTCSEAQLRSALEGVVVKGRSFTDQLRVKVEDYYSKLCTRHFGTEMAHALFDP